MKALLMIGYLLGLSHPPDGYAECGYDTLTGRTRYHCSMWRDHQWVSMNDNCADR